MLYSIIKNENVELIVIDENQDWKKYAINQNNYNAVIIRNIESLLDENDVTNVNEWLNGLVTLMLDYHIYIILNLIMITIMIIL